MILALSAVAFVAISYILISKVFVFLCNLFYLHVTARKKLEEQGVFGPKPASWLAGNSVEYREAVNSGKCLDIEASSHRGLLDRLQPWELKCKSIYGKRFLNWTVGWEPVVTVFEPQLVQDVFTSPHFEKSGIQSRFMAPLFGKGIVMANGKDWDLQRKLVNPAFAVQKVKGMEKIMNNCVSDVVSKWRELIERSPSSTVEIDVHSTFTLLTADVIARAAFGNNYDKKEEYIQLEQELQDFVINQSPLCLIPGYRYLPIKDNRKIWQINKKIRRYLQELIDARLSNNSDIPENDILGLLLTAAVSPSQAYVNTKRLELKMSKELLIDECKNFFFAGHETSSTVLTWTMMLLALYPEWQTKARQEVKQALQSESFPTPEMLPNLKIVGAILYETLRLYPPALRLRRMACKDTYIGNGKDKLLIPKNVSVEIPILLLHYNTEIWGEDASEFKPERFLDVGRQARPGEYIPFGVGPRVCIGRAFALTEMKIILSVLLHNFQWKLSPTYRHAPEARVTMSPKYGMQLVVSLCET